MKKVLALFLAITIVGTLANSSQALKQSSFKGENPLRLVSLSPAITETLFALGLGAEIVGVTTYCKYPKAAEEKEKIGGFLDPNLEKIVYLKPTHVFSESWPSSKTVPRLKQFQLNVVETLSPHSISEVFLFMEEVGKAVEQKEATVHLVSKMEKQLRKIKKKQREFSRRPTIYIEIASPTWTVGKKSFVTEALFITGAKNIFSDVELPALQASKEVIVQKNPEIIISFAAKKEEIEKRPGWKNIQAVQRGNIIDDFPQELLSHGNHRLIEGMEQFQKRLALIMENY